jgi:hypothetical protein
MNFLSNKSCNCLFSSLNSASVILYGAINIGSVPGTKSTQNSISLYRGNPGKSSGKTSINSLNIETCSH